MLISVHHVMVYAVNTETDLELYFIWLVLGVGDQQLLCKSGEILVHSFALFSLVNEGISQRSDVRSAVQQVDSLPSGDVILWSSIDSLC